MSKLKKKFQKDTQKRSYEKWYARWYSILGGFSYVLLACSCIASFKFYEYLLNEFTYATEAAYIITFVSSLFLSWLTTHCLHYYHQNKTKKKQFPWDVFIFPLVALLIWGAFADFKGSPEIAESFNIVPVNVEGKLLQVKIDTIESKKRALLDTYNWGDKIVMKLPPKDKPNKWHDVKADHITMNQYNEEKRLLLTDKSTHTTTYAEEIEKDSARLAMSKDVLKGFSVGFAALYLLIQVWRFNFKYTVAKKPKKKTKKKTPTQQGEEAYQTLLNENQALREEREAMVENERRQKQSNDNDLF